MKLTVQFTHIKSDSCKFHIQRYLSDTMRQTDRRVYTCQRVYNTKTDIL